MATRRAMPVRSPDDGDLVGLMAALGPDLTGRVHHAYRRTTDVRWWRRRYPGSRTPRWDHVALCGRQGLIPAEAWRTVDCGSCLRIVARRRRRLASDTGTAR